MFLKSIKVIDSTFVFTYNNENILVAHDVYGEIEFPSLESAITWLSYQHNLTTEETKCLLNS